jgi:hypothetical protein
MAAGFAKGQDADLRECGWGTAASGAAERTVVVRGIGHIDDKAVQSHGPHPAVECARRRWRTLQTDDLIGQEPERGDAETFARLAEGRSAWGSAAAKRLQPAEDLAVAIATEQAQSDDEPDHEPSRQSGAEGGILAGTRQDLFHLCARDDTFQSAESHLRGPRRERVGFLANVDHRSLLANHGVVANSCWQEALFLASAVERY